LLSLIYSLYGAAMTLIRIGPDPVSLHLGDIVALAFMSLPLLAFPIFLSSLYSMKTCRNWFSAYFIVNFLFDLIFYRHVFRLNFIRIPGIIVILAVVMINAAYLLVRHALRGSNEKIPGFINIMTR
jgi:hypothetical protein